MPQPSHRYSHSLKVHKQKHDLWMPLLGQLIHNALLDAVHIWTRCCCNSGRMKSLWTLTYVTIAHSLKMVNTRPAYMYRTDWKIRCLKSTVLYSWKITSCTPKIARQQSLGEVGTFIFFPLSSFLRMLHTKKKLSIFRVTVLKKIKGAFWDTLYYNPAYMLPNK